jgi:hypothetical protein
MAFAYWGGLIFDFFLKYIFSQIANEIFYIPFKIKKMANILFDLVTALQVITTFRSLNQDIFLNKKNWTS